MPSTKKLLPLAPIPDNFPVLKGNVTIDTGGGGTINSGDVYPQSTEASWEDWDLFKSKYSDESPGLWDPTEPKSTQIEKFDLWAHQKTAYDMREIIGVVPEDACIRFTVDLDIFNFTSAGSDPPCAQVPNGGHRQYLIYTQGTNYPETGTELKPAGGACTGHFGVAEWFTYSDEFIFFTTKTLNFGANMNLTWSRDVLDPECEEPGSPIQVPEEPVVLEVPPGVPLPPFRLTATKFNDGTVTDTYPDPGYVEMVPELDGSVTVNIGIPIDCSNCPEVEPGEILLVPPPGYIELVPQPDGNQQLNIGVPNNGGGGDLKLTAGVVTRRVMNPETGMPVERTVDVQVPEDIESGENMGTLFNELFYMLDQIMCGEVIYSRSLDKTHGTIVPYSEEGLS